MSLFFFWFNVSKFLSCLKPKQNVQNVVWYAGISYSLSFFLLLFILYVCWCFVCVKFPPLSSRHNCDLLWSDKWMQLLSVRNAFLCFSYTIPKIKMWHLQKKNGKAENKQTIISTQHNRIYCNWTNFPRLKSKLNFFPSVQQDSLVLMWKEGCGCTSWFFVVVDDVVFACIFVRCLLVKQQTVWETILIVCCCCCYCSVFSFYFAAKI